MTASPVTLEMQAKLAEWRKKSAEGTITLEEMKEAIIALRAGRLAAGAAASVAKRKAAAKVIPNADDLLDEIEGL